MNPTGFQEPPVFTDSTQHPERFFNLLPPDWQESIMPYWRNYSGTAWIYVLENKMEVLGGGIVFSTVSPDTMAYRQEARLWLEAGFLYIGFLWISEKNRNKKLASQWLQKVRNHYPDTPFWLTVDDLHLAPFYERNGFHFIKKVRLETHNEWVLATRNLS